MATKGGKFGSPRKLQMTQRVRVTVDEVKQRINSAVSSGIRVPNTVDQLLTSCVSEAEEPQRKAIFETCIAALNTSAGEGLQTQVSKEIIGRLLFEVDKLQGETLITLAELLIKGLKEGRHHALELFPKLLSVISTRKTIQYRKENGVRGEMSGGLQKNHLLNSLCGCRWDTGSVQHIAHMCQEIPMETDELDFLINKILRVMKEMKVTELPPLVYQLLVLSVKGQRSLVMNGVRALFNQINQEVLSASDMDTEDSVTSVSSSKRELLQAEGTVILHITTALKQDPELRKVFMNSLKAAQSSLTPDSLSPFNLALVLSLARIHIFSDTVFSFLKKVVEKSYKDQERVEASKWIQEMQEDTAPLETVMLEIVEHSVNGWDHVVEGLFIVGLQLMETFAPKKAVPSPQGTQYKASHLGSKLLYNTFKVHAMVRQELVTQLVNRILTNASTYTGHYTELLSELVEHHHQAALESLPKLKEAFSSLSLLPPQPALDMLHAVFPLVQFNVLLRDALLLVLRKSLFSKKMEPRKIAVAAYLMLLRKFKVNESLGVDSQSTQGSLTGSQVLVEVHAGSSSGTMTGNSALCLEILGVLRRALTKQYDVRLSLYEGLCSVFYSNFKLAEPILDLLLGQFEQYYKPAEDSLPPVRLSSCLSVGDTVSLLEPLDVLLQALQLCVYKYTERFEKAAERQEEDEPGPSSSLDPPEVLESANTALCSLVEQMVKAEPEDFELDRSSDYSAGNSVGQKNRVLARLVMSVYEALLEFTFTSGEFSQESTEKTLKLFQGYKRIADICQEGGGAGGKKAAGALTAKSNLTLQFVVTLLQALFIDSTPNHQQPLKVLRDSQAFPRYAVTVAVHKLHQVRERGTCDGAFADFRPDKLFKLCSQLGRILFKQVENFSTYVPSAKKDKGKSIPVLCLEGFSELLQAVLTGQCGGHQPHRSGAGTCITTSLASFLATVNPTANPSASLAERVHYLIRQLQRLVCGVLNTNMKEWSLKEVAVMVNMIATLAAQLEGGTDELSAVFEWTTTQCKEQNTSDVQLTKAFLSLLLTLNARLKGSSVKMLVKLSQDVHFHLGDVDEDLELEGDPHYAIVNRQTAPSGVLALLYSHFELVLQDADWLITRLKSGAVTDPSEEIFEKEASLVSSKAKSYCSLLCSRLNLVANGLSELVQTPMPTGSNATGLIKMVTKFYSTLCNLTKFCLLAFQQTSYIAVNYKSLASTVGSELSQQVYSFLTYIQGQQVQAGSSGAGEGSSKKGKGKGKGKGKSVADGGKAKIRQETRSFPSLIFAIEEFEKLLIQLSKKSKENLMASFKRSLARDFRIDVPVMNNVLNEEEEGEEEGEGEEGSSEGDSVDTAEDRPPVTKRRKLH